MKILPWARFYFVEASLSALSSSERVRREIETRWQERGETRVFPVSGCSMGNAVRDGSRVRVKFCTCPRPRRGDLVYIRREPQRIVHRYLGRIGPILAERGEANRYIGLHWRSSVLGIAQILETEEQSQPATVPGQS